MKSFRYPITFLPCTDLDATRRFYASLLKLEIALEQKECIIFKIGDAPHISYWGFCRHYKELLNPAKRVCLTLVVNEDQDVDRWTEILGKFGVNCTKKPEKTPQFGIYNAFFEDPMGYTLEIQAFDIQAQPKWH